VVDLVGFGGLYSPAPSVSSIHSHVIDSSSSSLATNPTQVTAAAKQMRALMPGTAWQERLGSGGTAFMSFCSILGGGSMGASKGSSSSGTSSRSSSSKPGS
jgi:hypothetical protein